MDFMRAPGGPVQRCVSNKSYCVFTFACILRFGWCIWVLAALISCEHVVLEGCLGAKRAPRGPQIALARLQRGGLEGAKCCIFVGFYSVFTFSMHLVFWLMLFLRVLRSVKLNDDSRDLSVSRSPTFSRAKMRFLKGTSWLHTPAKRYQ